MVAEDSRPRIQAETLAVFDAADAPGGPLTTREVADALDCTRRNAYGRLSDLAEDGAVATKKVGARARVWWRPVTDLQEGPGPVVEDHDQFGSLVDAVEEYAIFTLDADGTVATWNSGAARIKGYDREEVVGEHVSTFYTETDREAGRPEQNLATAAAEGSVEDEGWRVRADGSVFWANVTITAVHDGGDLRDDAKRLSRPLQDRGEGRLVVASPRSGCLGRTTDDRDRLLVDGTFPPFPAARNAVATILASRNCWYVIHR